MVHCICCHSRSILPLSMMPQETGFPCTYVWYSLGRDGVIDFRSVLIEAFLIPNTLTGTAPEIPKIVLSGSVLLVCAQIFSAYP